MRCPFCGAPETVSGKTCAQCHADIDYLHRRVYPGRQFAFFDATPGQPIAVDLTAQGASQPAQHRFTEPTIISRFDYAVSLGPLSARRIQGPWGRMIPDTAEPPPEELPLLSLPALDLVAVITDRRIYRTEDPVHIVAVAPGCAGQEAELEVLLSGQRVYRSNIMLDGAGMCVQRYDGLEEGEYGVHLRLPGRPSAQAQCSFSCAEFSLSPLIAILETHQIDGAQLHLQIKLTQLTAPYSGPVEIKLLSGERVLHRREHQAQEGRLNVELNLDERWWGGQQAMRVELVTPEGNTATIALPGVTSEEREHIQLCPLDRAVEASLAPFAGQVGSARGLYYGFGRTQDTPFELVEVVAAEGRLRALRKASLVRLLILNPLDGSRRALDFRNIEPGAELNFTVAAPYSLFTLAAFMERGDPYEAWGVVIRPVELRASIEAPETALPGQFIVARVEVDQPAQCLLLVYDARLEHESPLPKLAKRIFTHVRDNTRSLGAQRLAALRNARPEQYQRWEEMEGLFFGVRSLDFVTRGVMLDGGAKGTYGPDVLEEAAPELVMAMMLAPRESFPELAFLELFPVEDAAEKTIKLGDQIGAWRCRAYLLRGLDLAELTHDIPVTAPVYAELDLPAILGEGDSVTATARYHTQEAATLTITTPTGQFDFTVTGDGVVEFPLTAPGPVTTAIVAGDDSDVSHRTVDPPGVETVTASRLMLLRQNETVTGRRVVVYPSATPALQAAIEYLITYPFG